MSADESEPNAPHRLVVAVPRGTMSTMDLRFRARVRGGRIVVDEPVELPEGTEVELVAETAQTSQVRRPCFGSMAGQIRIRADFDAPLVDFADYTA